MKGGVIICDANKRCNIGKAVDRQKVQGSLCIRASVAAVSLRAPVEVAVNFLRLGKYSSHGEATAAPRSE